jgi:outer membrane protein
MKKILFISAFLFFSISASAQLKIGYVDSDFIRKQLTDFQDIDKKMDTYVKEWNDEIAKLEKAWKDKYDDYDKRKLLLSDQKRVEIEAELQSMEKKFLDLRQAKYGPGGDFQKKQEELLKPALDKVNKAIKKVAQENNFDFIFDRTGDIVFIYAKEEYDVTNLVLEKLK